MRHSLAVCAVGIVALGLAALSLSSSTAQDATPTPLRETSVALTVAAFSREAPERVTQAPEASAEVTAELAAEAMPESTEDTEAPVQLIMTYTEDDFALIVLDAGRPISLEGLTIVNNQTDVSIELADLAPLNLRNVQTPVCYYFYREGTRQALFSQCSQTNPIVRAADGRNFVWYDSVQNVVSAIDIQRDGASQGRCNNPEQFCPVTYTPLPVPPTPTPLPSPVPTQPQQSQGSRALRVGSLVESDICVQTGDTVNVSTTGSVRVGEWVGTVTADGTESGAFGFPLGDGYDLVRPFPHGMLMCRIRGDDAWQQCGASRTFTAESDGCLDFHINDNDLTDNSGAFDVVVEILR